MMPTRYNLDDITIRFFRGCKRTTESKTSRRKKAEVQRISFTGPLKAVRGALDEHTYMSMPSHAFMKMGNPNRDSDYMYKLLRDELKAHPTLVALLGQITGDSLENFICERSLWPTDYTLSTVMWGNTDVCYTYAQDPAFGHIFNGINFGMTLLSAAQKLPDASPRLLYLLSLYVDSFLPLANRYADMHTSSVQETLRLWPSFSRTLTWSQLPFITPFFMHCALFDESRDDTRGRINLVHILDKGIPTVCASREMEKTLDAYIRNDPLVRTFLQQIMYIFLLGLFPGQAETLARIPIKWRERVYADFVMHSYTVGEFSAWAVCNFPILIHAIRAVLVEFMPMFPSIEEVVRIWYQWDKFTTMVHTGYDALATVLTRHEAQLSTLPMDSILQLVSERLKSLHSLMKNQQNRIIKDDVIARLLRAMYAIDDAHFMDRKRFMMDRGITDEAAPLLVWPHDQEHFDIMMECVEYWDPDEPISLDVLDELKVSPESKRKLAIAVDVCCKNDRKNSFEQLLLSIYASSLCDFAVIKEFLEALDRRCQVRLSPLPVHIVEQQRDTIRKLGATEGGHHVRYFVCLSCGSFRGYHVETQLQVGGSVRSKRAKQTLFNLNGCCDSNLFVRVMNINAKSNDLVAIDLLSGKAKCWRWTGKKDPMKRKRQQTMLETNAMLYYVSNKLTPEVILASVFGKHVTSDAAVLQKAASIDTGDVDKYIRLVKKRSTKRRCSITEPRMINMLGVRAHIFNETFILCPFTLRPIRQSAWNVRGNTFICCPPVILTRAVELGFKDINVELLSSLQAKSPCQQFFTCEYCQLSFTSNSYAICTVLDDRTRPYKFTSVVLCSKHMKGWIVRPYTMYSYSEIILGLRQKWHSFKDVLDGAVVYYPDRQCNMR